MRTILIAVAGVALAAVVVVGLIEASARSPSANGPPPPPPARVGALLAGSPPPLAALHGEQSRLLDGGPLAFRKRLASLRGYPVVVNKWASWCGPCRAEFPYFQRLSAELGRRVAFVGVNSADNDGEARAFLARLPVSYPSYRDPRLAVAQVFSGVAAYPTTAFYDARGRLQYIHQGAYLSEAKLRADIARYAG